MRKLIFVSHCILNTCSKVRKILSEDPTPEEQLRREFIQLAIGSGIQLVQLPCPEFTLYGPKRWGHVKDQFDNVFYRNHCRALLTPFLEQLKEYIAHPEAFRIVAIIGVEGSPSCGVNRTSRGDWGGEFSGRSDLNEVLHSIRREEESGVFFDVLREMLRELHVEIPIAALDSRDTQRTLALLGDT